MQAQDVPMAVPMSCLHQVDPNLNTLKCITSLVSSNNNSNRFLQVSSNSSPNSSRYAFRIGRASSGCMLVYIEVASDVKSREKVGVHQVGRSHQVVMLS